MNDRHTKIVEIVNKAVKIEVNSLADMLGVSSVTIRKDLDQLEDRKSVV